MKRSIRWDPILACGIPSMEDDHRRLIDSVAKLEAAFATQDSAAIAQAFCAVLDLTERHFSEQERSMRQHRVSRHDFMAHKAEHDDFLTQLRFFRDRLGKCAAGLHGDITEFVATWFIAHILGQDRHVSLQFLPQAA